MKITWSRLNPKVCFPSGKAYTNDSEIAITLCCAKDHSEQLLKRRQMIA